jgi:thiol-disulfide isomerase/thioredoxin
MSGRCYFLLALLMVFCSPSAIVIAQDGSEPNPIKWTAKAQAMPSSGSITVQLLASIERGWHLYSLEKVEGGPAPTRISVLPGQTVEIAGEIESPAPRSAYDPNFQVATEFYEGEVAFIIPLKSTTSSLADKVRVQVRYQTCTPTICLPPKLIELEALLNSSVAVPTVPTNDKPAAKKKAEIGDTVGDFEFVDFTGKSRRFSEFRGKVVLLDFWASWCSPCLADIPNLKSVYQRYRAQGFEIVGMNSETLGQNDSDPQFAKDAQARAREIVSARGVNWMQATSESSLPVAVGWFGVESLPAKILIDQSGKVIGRVKNLSELDDILPKLFKSQP